MAVKKTLFWAYCDICLLYFFTRSALKIAVISLCYDFNFEFIFRRKPIFKCPTGFWLDNIKPKQIFVVHIESFCIPKLIECEVSCRITAFAGEPGETIIITILKLVFCAVEAQQCTLGFVQDRSELMLAYNYYSQGIIISDLCIYF